MRKPQKRYVLINGTQHNSQSVLLIIQSYNIFGGKQVIHCQKELVNAVYYMSLKFLHSEHAVKGPKRSSCKETSLIIFNSVFMELI